MVIHEMGAQAPHIALWIGSGRLLTGVHVRKTLICRVKSLMSRPLPIENTLQFLHWNITPELTKI